MASKDFYKNLLLQTVSLTSVHGCNYVPPPFAHDCHYAPQTTAPPPDTRNPPRPPRPPKLQPPTTPPLFHTHFK